MKKFITEKINKENAKIVFRNFAGVEGPYNKAGDRSFALLLEHDLAEALANDGWNVKFPKPLDNDFDGEDDRLPYISVSVSFKNIPPTAVLIAGDKVTKLDEDSIGILDTADIQNADVVISPYNWTLNGKSGVKAYLEAIYVTIKTNYFYDKYGI